MYSSFAFEPGAPVGDRNLIPLVAGLAVRSAIEDLIGIDVELRWPNDLMLGNAKVGGIIVESSGGTVVVGCGVNFEWTTPMEGAAALGTATDDVSSLDLANAWVDRFLSRIDRGPDAWGLDEYRAVCGTIGRHVSYAGGSGLAVGIADDGSLLVEAPAGIVAVRSGEVRLHGSATLRPNRRD
jgi:BirA family biotin operon repressor/biotin-[acetyl-CoA-carboxylase] ligase